MHTHRYPVGKGADIFISVWNLHHSPHLWKDPEAFRPDRFAETNSNAAFGGKWAGEPTGCCHAHTHACARARAKVCTCTRGMRACVYQAYADVCVCVCVCVPRSLSCARRHPATSVTLCSS